MVTTVSLQPPFEYYWWVVLIAILLAAACIAILVYVIRKLLKIEGFIRKKNPAIHVPPPRKLYEIKNDYTEQMERLAATYANRQIDKRAAYQRLSLQIRGFVHEATGLNVENYTKSEIKAFGIRQLDRLMEEYYIPEFAEDERSRDKDFMSSCNKALGVVRAWS
jgi:hypothetical protein